MSAPLGECTEVLSWSFACQKHFNISSALFLCFYSAIGARWDRTSYALNYKSKISRTSIPKSSLEFTIIIKNLFCFRKNNKRVFELFSLKS